MSHTFYCSTIECDKEVDSYEGLCDSCSKEQMSHETSECPGCGNDIYCGADGYCSNCWVERFGVEDDLSTITHKCSGEWDYSRGILVCDFEDDEDCPSHHPKKCTAKFDLVSGLWECVNENPHKCSDTWSYDYSPRENHPPPSPIRIEEQDLEEQIAAIEEKLKTSMTVDQKADWEFLWHRAMSKRRALNCSGCRDDSLNQQGHMEPGGCLYDPDLDEPPRADY